MRIKHRNSILALAAFGCLLMTNWPALGQAGHGGDPVGGIRGSGNDTLATAARVACGFSDDTLDIDLVDDVDYYRFSLGASLIVSLDVDTNPPASGLDSLLGLFDSSGGLLISSNDDSARGEPASTDSYLEMVLEAGTYFIAVTSFGDADFDGTGGSTSGAYALRVTCGPRLFGSTGTTGATLIGVDPATGAGTPRDPHGAFGSVTEIEFRSDGVLFGSTGGGTANIITIDPVNGTEALVGSHSSGQVNGLEFVGDTLYGSYVPGPGFQFADLVIIDQTTGDVMSFLGASNVGPIGGLAYDEHNGIMYGVATDVLVTLDLTTGAATLVGPTGFSNVPALEFGPGGTLYGGLGSNVGGGDAGSLITIDPSTGVGTVVGSTGFQGLSGLAFFPSSPEACNPPGNEFTVATGSAWPDDTPTHFRSQDDDPLGLGTDIAEVGECCGGSSDEEVRGLAEFDVIGGRGTSAATLRFEVAQLGGLDGQPAGGFDIEVESYAGNNLEELGDYSASADQSLGSLSTDALSPGEVLTFDITSAYNAAVNAGALSIGVRLRATSDPMGAAIVFENFVIETAECIFTDGFESGDLSAWSSSAP